MRQSTLIPFLVALVAAKLALDHLSDADLFWHLRLGLDILANGLPAHVEHTWTLSNVPFASNDWLAEVLYAFALTKGGFVLLGLVKAVLAAGLALALFAASKRASGSPRAAGLACGVLLFVAATHFGTRPTLAGHLLLAVELLLLELIAAGRVRFALLLPPLFALWFNVHGTWAVGLGPLAVALGSSFVPLKLGRFESRKFDPRAKPWLVGAAAATPLALLANPFGLGFVLRPFRVFTGQLVSRTAEYRVFDEWAPVPPTNPSFWILVGVVALGVFAAVRTKKPLPLYDTALVLLALAMAFNTARYHVTFAVLAAPLLARLLAPLVPESTGDKPGLNLGLAAVTLLLFGGIGAMHLALVDREIAAAEPVEAVEALASTPLRSERGFHYFDWGGYLLFRDVTTFVDGRFEPFLGGPFQDYLALERTGDVAALETRGVKWILEPPSTPMAQATRDRPGWRVAYEDGRSVLFVRD